ncbi:diphthine--ammonia ligase [Candidatus Bathyarchaeota archaeon]|nr:diphthine--ammonia ligase [Candidatus Bathyarchaeota archaeon]
MVTLRLAALFSGGKDSTYAAHLASLLGHDVSYLVTMLPARDDSWMFHTVNIGLAPLVAQAMGIESVVVDTSGVKEEELQDLKPAIAGLNVDGLVTGAIASSYQRSRVDDICSELEIEHVAPLWGRESSELVREMIVNGMTIIVTAVAAMGLGEKWLGRTLDLDALEELKSLSERFGVDVCGEGGEMETLVLDAPWFTSRLEIVSAKREWDGVRGSLQVEEAHLIQK